MLCGRWMLKPGDVLGSSVVADILHTSLAFVVAIATLVAVHEYGHFLAARRLGVRVDKFSIGFGPSIFSWRSKDGEVTYVIAAIPLGGYVKMFGEQPGETDELDGLTEGERKRAFNAQPVWSRALIAFAGPAFNFLFAIFAYMLIAWIGQQVMPPVVGDVYPASPAARSGLMADDRIVQVEDVQIHSWQEVEEELRRHVGHQIHLGVLRDGGLKMLTLDVPRGKRDPLLVNVADEWVGISPGVQIIVDGVMAGSPAALAGLQEGDVIREVDGQPVHSVRVFIHRVQQHENKPMSIGVMREETMMRFTLLPQSDEEGKVRIGVRLAAKAMHPSEVYRMGLLDGFFYGLERTWDMTALTVKVIGKMITSAISPENLGGPIAIAQLAGKTAEMGVVSFLSFLALISVNLAVLNLMPVPVLDGGHLMYLAIEGLRGRPLSRRTMEWTQAVGIFMIVLLMVFAFYNDIARLFRE